MNINPSKLDNKANANFKTTVFLFASVNRSDAKAKPVMIRVLACSELEARRVLVHKYILSLAARIPFKENRNV